MASRRRKSLRLFGEGRGQSRAIHAAVLCRAWKGLLDERHGLALIEAVHLGVGIEHGDAALAEHGRNCRLAHADGTGETDDHHQRASTIPAAMRS